MLHAHYEDTLSVLRRDASRMIQHVAWQSKRCLVVLATGWFLGMPMMPLAEASPSVSASSRADLIAPFVHDRLQASQDPLWLEVFTASPPADDPIVESSEPATLLHQADHYREEDRYEEAAVLYGRVLGLLEASAHRDSLLVSTAMNNLALVHVAQGHISLARPLLQRALAMRAALLGPDHVAVAAILHNLAGLDRTEGKGFEAEQLYQQVLAGFARAWGPGDPRVASVLNNLAILYSRAGRYVEAKLAYRRSLAILQQGLGSRHPHVLTTLKNYADLLRQMHEPFEAQLIESTVAAIRSPHSFFPSLHSIP